MASIKENVTKTTNLNLSVPSEIFLVLRESENQFVANMKKFTALFLFQNQKLSIGQCAALANMTEEDFIYFLGENKISGCVVQNRDRAVARRNSNKEPE